MELRLVGIAVAAALATVLASRLRPKRLRARLKQSFPQLEYPFCAPG